MLHPDMLELQTGNVLLPMPTRSVQGTYYLLLRCQPERVFFREAQEYVACRERLINQLNRNNGVLLDYCLTASEIRLVIYLPPKLQPGRFVQEHFSSWLRALNDRDQREGHVLVERTRSQPVECPQALRRIACFLARYPVHTGLASTPSAYRYSGYRSHLGFDPAAGLGVRLMLSYFGESVLDGRDQLRRAVRSLEISQEEYEQLRKVHRRRHMEASAQAVKQDTNVPLQHTEGQVREKIATRVEREVCLRHGASPTALFATPTPPGVAILRSLIVHVLTTAKVMRIATLARRYRRAPQTLKGEMLRHRRNPSSAALFAIELEELLDRTLEEQTSVAGSS